jgi:hypothetical protein
MTRPWRLPLLLLLAGMLADLVTGTCTDNDSQLALLAAAYGLPNATCALAVTICNHQTVGAVIRNACPVTCGACPTPAPTPAVSCIGAPVLVSFACFRWPFK